MIPQQCNTYDPNGTEQLSCQLVDTDVLLALLNEAELPRHLLNQISQQFKRLEDQIQVQAQLIDQLRQESLTDSLTGLPNRRAYSEKLNAEWTRAMRSRQPLALISIDVDYFKQYNDRYGHDQGDRCLQEVASTLKHSVQRGGDLVCRVGGEEFMVVVPNATAQDALALADKIRLNLEVRALKHEQSPGSKIVTVSMGIAHTVPNPDQTSDELYKAADQALYRAKQQGRNRITLADPSPQSLRDTASVLVQNVWKLWQTSGSEDAVELHSAPSEPCSVQSPEPLPPFKPSPAQLPEPSVAQELGSQSGAPAEAITVRLAQTAIHHSRAAFTRARLHCLARMSGMSAPRPWTMFGLLDS